MKKKSAFSKYIVLAVIALAVYGLVKHFHIDGFRVVKDGVLYASAQPRGMDYTRLMYKYHIGTIVNVRMESEHREQNWYNEEVTWTKNNGMHYIELPVAKDNPIPDAASQAEFLKIMADKRNLPVLLHGSGNKTRVALLTAVWLIKTQDVLSDDAMAQAEKFNDKPLTPEQKQFIMGINKQ
jgi:protein tyrosine/serine phosphatase